MLDFPRRPRYFLALTASLAGIMVLAWFPAVFRSSQFFPATCVALLVVLVLGVGPGIVAQVVTMVGTVILLLAPGSELQDPTTPFGGRLGRAIALFVLMDLVAWRIERGRRAAALRERELWESDTRYRHILEQASDGIILGSRDGRILLANQRICEMLGYSESEILALKIPALYDGEPLGWEGLERASVVLRERQLRRKDGSSFLAELSVRRTADGNAQAIVRDITERRRAEEAIREEHALLESILETSVAGILVVTPEGRVVFLNPTAEAALGITKEQIADRTALPPGWRFLTLEGCPLPEAERPARRVVATGEPVQDARLIIERPDGERRILSFTAAPLRDGSRRITAVVLSLSDITEQQVAQLAIAEREEQLQRITSAVPGVVYQFVVDADGKGRFTFVSERARQLFGLSAEEIMADGRRLREVVNTEDYAEMTAALRHASRSLEPLSRDVRVHVPGERTRWLRAIATGTPGRDPGSVVWIGVVVDITEQKSLEQELRQAQKMDSLGRLAGGVAHDFNNLLTVIRGYADVLSSELSAEDPRLTEVREIRRAADRATSLTRQLLAMSRRQVLVPREVELHSLVQEMERMLRRVIGADIRIATERGTELGWVRADPGQLEQVILNLAVNARDAMPSGGTLTFETARKVVGKEPEESYVRGVPPGDYVVLRVADTGIGMDREIQSQIFEPFFTTKPIGEGTGLGLSTVYGIVQQSNGAITVESDPGSGTSFRVFLPRIAEPAGHGRDVGTARPAVRSEVQRATVLLVEDDEGVRHLTSRVLEQYGYRVLVAPDGAEALQLLSGREEVAAVVSDVVMPGMSGTELIERLRLQRPELPVLLLSGYAGDEVGGKLRPGCRQAFLQKPFSPDALATALEELLADSRPPATAG